VVHLGKGIYRTSKGGLDRLKCKRADISALFFFVSYIWRREAYKTPHAYHDTAFIYASHMVIVVGNAELRKNIYLAIDKLHII
jgi:hypothetical protein